MCPSFNPAQGSAAYRIPRAGTSLVLLALGCWGIANVARMMPGLVRSVTRPCAGCYLGAFEPPLERFELPAGKPQDAGTGAGNGERTVPALSVVQAAVSDTEVAQSRGKGDWFGLGNLIAGLPPGSLILDSQWYGSQIPGDRDWDRDALAGPGVALSAAMPWLLGSGPYWRVDLQRHLLQIGTFWLNATSVSAGGQIAGAAQAVTEAGIVASYQFVTEQAAGNIISPDSILINQTRSLDETSGHDRFRTNLSWAVADAIAPSIQYFRTAGAIEAIPYLWPGAWPNTAGVIAGFSFAPWHSAGSRIQFLNLRIAAQYVADTEFHGSGRSASVNNGIYFSFWGALRF
jgi:hypothetical protein